MNPENRKIVYHEHGPYGETLSLTSELVPELQARQVLVEIQAAAIHPSDIGLIEGSYGVLRKLPAVGGREAVGKIIQLGTEVKEDLLHTVVSIPDEIGAW